MILGPLWSRTKLIVLELVVVDWREVVVLRPQRTNAPTINNGGNHRLEEFDLKSNQQTKT
jgi:hypothetical protein